ncbi:MAG: tetratricopeptide repeat protein [Bacteroidales bacterium]|nr:tetratricopeptide repeat protein [Bacteroidales bacterium]
MKTDKFISYIIIFSYLILILFGITSLFNPDWLLKISEPGRKTEANTPFEHANKFMYEGNFKLAIENYNEALKIDKENRNIYGNLAIAYIKLGNFEMAEDCFKEVERLNEGLDSTALFIYFISRADLEIAKANKFNLLGSKDISYFRNAQNYCLKAIDLMPFDISTRYKYCSLSMLLNEDSIAIVSYKETLAMDQKSETFYYASLYDEYLTYVANSDEENAASLSAIIDSEKQVNWNRYDTISFKLNEKSQRETATAYLNLGELFYRNMYFEKADVAFSNCIKINPQLNNNVATIKEKY